MRRLRSRLPLAAILLAVLLASCGMPGVTLRVSSVNAALPGLEGSYCQSGGCSGSCGDYGPLVPKLVQVRVTPPVTLEIQTAPGVTEIHGDIWEGDALSGRPLEAFVLAGQSGRYVSQVMAPGHRYYISIDIRWSLPLNTGGQAHFFRVEVLPP
jgi:hypothetical protein